MSISYDAADIAVRDDLRDAHEGTWRQLAKAGRWFTGAERVAIAAEVRAARSCELCRERKQAISPYAVSGLHDGAERDGAERDGAERDGATNDTAAIDAIHRVVTDPGRLSKKFYDEAIAAMGEDRYAELIGLTVKVVAIDVFCFALGIEPHPLPQAHSGQPSRQRPAGVKPWAAWLPSIAPGQAGRDEADLFPAPQVPNVLRALTLAPDEVRGVLSLGQAQYVPPEGLLDVRFERALSRPQIEFVAAKVSALSECFY